MGVFHYTRHYTPGERIGQYGCFVIVHYTPREK